MQLELTIEKQLCRVQEPVLLFLKLKNTQQQTVSIPFQYQETDVVTYEVYNADGTLLCRCDGYLQWHRFTGKHQEFLDPQTMQTAPVGPGEAIEWQTDLLTYCDLASGTYTVRASFTFSPSSIHAVSNVCTIEIVQDSSTGTDMIADLTYVPTFYTLDNGRDNVRYQIRGASTPSNPHVTGAFDYKLGAGARISLAGYLPDIDDMMADRFRWVAWVENSRLHAVWFNNNQKAQSPFTFDFAAEGNYSLAARPVHGKDHSCSCFVLHEHKGSFTLLQLFITINGVWSEPAQLSDFPILPNPLECRVIAEGLIVFIWGTDGCLPVNIALLEQGKWGRQVQVINNELIFGIRSLSGESSDAHKLLALVPEIGRVHGNTQGIIAVVQKTLDNSSSIIKIIRIPVGESTSDNDGLIVVDYTMDGQLSGQETVASMHTAYASECGIQHCLVTSRGRVIHGINGKVTSQCDDITVNPGSEPRLLLGKRTMYLFYHSATNGITGRQVWASGR